MQRFTIKCWVNGDFPHSIIVDLLDFHNLQILKLGSIVHNSIFYFNRFSKNPKLLLSWLEVVFFDQVEEGHAGDF
jgi:hypothetical protein